MNVKTPLSFGMSNLGSFTPKRGSVWASIFGTVSGFEISMSAGPSGRKEPCREETG